MLYDLYGKDVSVKGENFKLLEILLDGSCPAGEIRSRAIEYPKEHRVDKSVIMTVAGAVDNKIDYNALKQKISICILYLKRLG